DEADPAPLAERDVLDQAGQGQLAGRRAPGRLLVVQAVDGDAEEMTVLGEQVEQVRALDRLGVGDGGHLVRLPVSVLAVRTNATKIAVSFCPQFWETFRHGEHELPDPATALPAAGAPALAGERTG